jgi:mRNA interferase RelE/StbE
MLRLRLSKDAARFLDKLPAKHARQIAEKIAALQADPTLSTEDVKGHPPFRRLKSGEYRIIHFIEDDTLYVTLIGKRNNDDIYKQIARFRR